jgi:hypothetical protein
LGKKYRQKAKDIYKALETHNWIDNNLLKQYTLYIPIPNTHEFTEYVLLEGEFAFEPLFNPNDIFDIDCQNVNNANNILIRIDFTYDEQIAKLAHLKQFVSNIQQTRKYMGLKPWNKIVIHIYKDDFDIVSSAVNLEYIIKRLECDVIYNSTYGLDNYGNNSPQSLFNNMSSGIENNIEDDIEDNTNTLNYYQPNIDDLDKECAKMCIVYSVILL